MLRRQPTFFAFLRSSGRLVRQAAVLCVTAAVLTACGGGESSPGSAVGPQMMIFGVLPDRGRNETPAAAPSIPLGRTIRSNIDFGAESGGDTDWFRTQIPSPGTLMINDEGVHTNIKVFEDSDGTTEIPGRPGSWIGTIPQRVIDAGGNVYIRITGYTMGRYDLSIEHMPAVSMSPMSP